ncbi:hypothetical protein G7085_09395 [Tessaracoccus sp. HDW20]|uniref:glycosyl hydrolase family 95 catalytic domain-containing protein n=1 Tax=Tessaracoccus coleopterorum TaxID=2714950 RepID=UPI0018D37092|nr:hypothetical protein [Tessaracoccus coleopterorum]NHB84749.1 hypothetical protein [Tessaracoccus coleopterorum]
MDPALEALAFQFGRYLSIATSRPGTLPSNLNGAWLIGDASQFWNADYHFNINVQMNYWPNLVTNLAETAEPFIEWMESLRVPGRVTAGATSAVPSGPGEENGFLVHTVNNIFGLTAPYGVQEFGWNIGGSTWALQNVGEYHKFTQDGELLRDRIYPMQRELANFWLTYLWWSPYQDRLVVTPSVSAEQGPPSTAPPTTSRSCGSCSATRSALPGSWGLTTIWSLGGPTPGAARSRADRRVGPDQGMVRGDHLRPGAGG